MKTICIYPDSVSHAFCEALRKLPKSPNFVMDRPKEGSRVTSYTFDGDVAQAVQDTLHEEGFVLRSMSMKKKSTVLHFENKTPS